MISDEIKNRTKTVR